jgi:hypothetical protein
MEPEGSLPCLQELVTILSQMNPVHNTPSHLFKTFLYYPTTYT